MGPEFLTDKKHIKAWLKSMGIKKWSINKTGLVDVDGSVNLDRILGTLTQLPVQFGKVDGSFSCEHNQLANLEGSPEKVGRDFW